MLWLCNSTIPRKPAFRICFLACVGICFLTSVRKSSFMYLYTKTRWSGIVSCGNRRNGLLRSRGRKSSLKLENMAGGMSFKTNLSCPDLEHVSTSSYTIWRCRYARTLPTKHDRDVVSLESSAWRDSDVQKHRSIQGLGLPYSHFLWSKNTEWTKFVRDWDFDKRHKLRSRGTCTG